MKKFLKNEEGVVAIVAALLIAVFAGSAITVVEPKVAKVMKNDILHLNDPNYDVPANPSPTKH